MFRKKKKQPNYYKKIQGHTQSSGKQSEEWKAAVKARKDYQKNHKKRF